MPPMSPGANVNREDKESKEHKLKDVARTLLFQTEGALRPGIEETPLRFARAWMSYTEGYATDPAEVLKTFEDGAEGIDEMISVSAIPVYSLCEHHLAPFFGTAHVGYIPDKRIVGISKFVRLVNVFSRRLQVQERLTRQIADALYEALRPRGVGVVLRCRHLCMESRGVRAPGTFTMTTALLGCLKDGEARAEFLASIKE